MPNDHTAQTCRLPDGRTIGYAEFGDRDGTPMLFLHGQPGSRLSGELMDPSAKAAGVRLIAPDRPGIGLSDPVERRTHSDHCAELSGLLENLELGPTRVLGWSAGGAYALAWACACPELVPAVGVLAGVGPGGALDGALRSLGRRLSNPADWIGPSSIDVAAAATPILARAFREGVRQGAAAARLETRLLGGDWDFDPASVRVPALFWHGKEDALVPYTQTRDLAAQIAGARTELLPAEGHVSLLLNHGESILNALRLPTGRA